MIPQATANVGHHDCSDPLPRKTSPVEKLGIPEDKVTGLQWYGNTQFAHSLGDGWTGTEFPPDYGYSQGLHAGLDMFAEGGTSVKAGVSGRIVTIGSNAWTPQYIEIEISPGVIIRLGHLAKDSTQLHGLDINSFVTPDTIIGTVSESQGHVHIEFEIDIPGSYKDKLVNPWHFLPDEIKNTLIRISDDPARQNYAGTHFYSRSDGMWTSITNQPVINEYGVNLNVGQGKYQIPANW